jgi:hypothetical protein
MMKEKGKREKKRQRKKKFVLRTITINVHTIHVLHEDSGEIDVVDEDLNEIDVDDDNFDDLFEVIDHLLEVH